MVYRQLVRMPATRCFFYNSLSFWTFHKTARVGFGPTVRYPPKLSYTNLRTTSTYMCGVLIYICYRSFIGSQTTCRLLFYKFQTSLSNKCLSFFANPGLVSRDSLSEQLLQGEVGLPGSDSLTGAEMELFCSKSSILSLNNVSENPSF